MTEKFTTKELIEVRIYIYIYIHIYIYIYIHVHMYIYNVYIYLQKRENKLLMILDKYHNIIIESQKTKK